MSIGNISNNKTNATKKNLVNPAYHLTKNFAFVISNSIMPMLNKKYSLELYFNF